MAGKFIVVEGGDGAGKDTQIDLLRQELSNDEWLFVRWDSTSLGEKIRSLLLSSEGERITSRAEFFLLLTAHSELMEEKIIPALQSGKNVISNRSPLSTLAYQVYGHEKQAWLPEAKHMIEFVYGDQKPDLYILLDVTPEVGIARMTKRRPELDRFERESVDFHSRIREGYLSHIEEYPHVTINGEESPEHVYMEVKAAIDRILSS